MFQFYTLLIYNKVMAGKWVLQEMRAIEILITKDYCASINHKIS